jgi:hypothetical protein
MSNVSECIDLYLTDSEVTDAQFRRFIIEAHALDLIDNDARITYWHALREAKRERMEREGA